LGSALFWKTIHALIHVEDLCAIYLEGLRTPRMPYNAAISDSTTNSGFLNIGKPSVWVQNLAPMSQVLIKMVLGEMSKIVLTGRRVSSLK
jgi:NAD dependent epimerase/dehydratase family enzyme